MKKTLQAPVVGLQPTSTPKLSDLQAEFTLQAAKLFKDYQAGLEYAATLFRTYHPRATQVDFIPDLLDARQVILVQSMRGQKLNFEHLKKQSKALLKDLVLGDASGLSRLHIGR